ncbi:hypothetical protein BJ322DRAFT_1209138 [Thelephora terrestris]|uniref:Vps72/YL1 C-terminal domain-containing protein n=1 Tax=Thelephora terrestris TaxID=56493 RepID=A0A9P6HIG7_9AGAM|nr:hypothetical protein BJ322DRAFT_1209138 [Thelephora terrestris]
MCAVRNPVPISPTAIMPPKGGFKKKAEGSEASTPTLVEQFSYLHVPKPFKNPKYTKNQNRRAKNLKTVLTQEREREKQDRERRRLEKEEAMDVDGVPPPGPSDIPFEEDTPTYTSIEAPPSLLPARKYCDITGLEARIHSANYTDPATGLRYHDKNVYQLIKGLASVQATRFIIMLTLAAYQNMAAARDYLAARGVNPIVR